MKIRVENISDAGVQSFEIEGFASREPDGTVYITRAKEGVPHMSVSTRLPCRFATHMKGICITFHEPNQFCFTADGFVPEHGCRSLREFIECDP